MAKKLAAEAAKYLKPCVFELGGKAPVVVSAPLSSLLPERLDICRWHPGP